MKVLSSIIKFITIVAVMWFFMLNVIGPAWDAEAEYNHNKVSEYTQKLEQRDFNRAINK